jgi:hypothetical protein
MGEAGPKGRKRASRAAIDTENGMVGWLIQQAALLTRESLSYFPDVSTGLAQFLSATDAGDMGQGS